MEAVLSESDNQIISLPSDSSLSDIDLVNSSLKKYNNTPFEDLLDPLTQNSTNKYSEHMLCSIENLCDRDEYLLASSLENMSISEKESSTYGSFKEKDRSNHNREYIVNNNVIDKHTNFTFNKPNHNNNNCKIPMEVDSKFVPIIPHSPVSLSPIPAPVASAIPTLSLPHTLQQQSFPSLTINLIPEADNNKTKRGKGRPRKSKDNNIVPSISPSSSECNNNNNNKVKRKKGRPRRTIDNNNSDSHMRVSIEEPPPMHVSKKCGIDLSDEIKEWFEDVCSKKTEKKNLPIPNDVINKFKMIKDEIEICEFCKKNKRKRKLDCFLYNGKYICFDCAGDFVKKEEVNKLQHWESEVKDGKGLCCQRLNHWYPVHDYVELKNCDDDGRPVRGEAYKSSQQCIFCRNFKKYEYRRNKKNLECK